MKENPQPKSRGKRQQHVNTLKGEVLMKSYERVAMRASADVKEESSIEQKKTPSEVKDVN